MKKVDELVERYLRQNAPHKDGTPGTFSLRFLVWPQGAHEKPRRVEIGLGTNDRAAAVYVARVMLLGIWALGGRFSGRLALLGERREVARIADVLPRGRSRCPGCLPPAGEVDRPKRAE